MNFDEYHGKPIVYCVMQQNKVLGVFSTRDKAAFGVDKLKESYGDQFHISTRIVDYYADDLLDMMPEFS